ncbi:MAG TPA: hypothetical protein VIU62_09450 [Chloroflexota bacterium]
MAAAMERFGGALGGRIGRRGMLGGMVGASALALAACGTAATTGAASAPADVQNVTMTVMGSVKLGPDGKMHDAFTPADFTVTQNRPVQVTVYSYDNAPHSVTAPALNLNPTIAPSTKDGVPAVTTFTFTPTKTGKFLWNCDLPCDGDANGWAMANPGFMSGYITVVGA